MITVRRSTPEDVHFLFDWRNEKETRQNALNSKEIRWEDHCRWFEQKASDPLCLIFIVMVDDVPAGQVRFELEDTCGSKIAWVHINLGANFRNKGYGTQGLKITTAQFMKEIKPDKVMAYIKENNMPSLRSFEKAGFKKTGMSIIKSCQCCVMEFK